jgi:DNA-binding HxlR family transcriptional regulator
VARALDLVGERWALLVVRELLLGPKRFTDLRAGMPHVSPDVLSQRLRELEEAGVVRRRKLAPPAGSRVYELTERGLELEPAILALGRWGSRAPMPDAAEELGVEATVIALKTLFDPGAADGLAASYELCLGEQCFRATVADGKLDVTRGNMERPDARISTDTATLSAVLWHDRPLSDALRSGELEIGGSPSAVTRFLDLFPLT